MCLLHLFTFIVDAVTDMQFAGTRIAQPAVCRARCPA